MEPLSPTPHPPVTPTPQPDVQVPLPQLTPRRSKKGIYMLLGLAVVILLVLVGLASSGYLATKSFVPTQPATSDTNFAVAPPTNPYGSGTPSPSPSSPYGDGYHCVALCSPSATGSTQVKQDCAALATSTSCLNYSNTQYPYRCQWVPSTFMCPIVP